MFQLLSAYFGKKKRSQNSYEAGLIFLDRTWDGLPKDASTLYCRRKACNYLRIAFINSGPASLTSGERFFSETARVTSSGLGNTGRF